VRSQFFARSSAGEVIAESPMFPWRSSDPPPETPQARAAYEELDAALRSRGWAPVRRREQTTWFGSAYTRRAA
jgi:hypothetical protein